MQADEPEGAGKGDMPRPSEVGERLPAVCHIKGLRCAYELCNAVDDQHERCCRCPNDALPVSLPQGTKPSGVTVCSHGTTLTGRAAAR